MTKRKITWTGPAVCALAFLIPAAVMLWAYSSLGMAPWGDKTVLVSDMSSQYVEFFCALKYGDLFFSWSKALGTSYIGVFSYYVSSPLSFLTLLFPNEAMPFALMLLTVLKLGLVGASFAWFALRRFPGSGSAALLCAVSYALMNYNAAYSLCIMWLDGVIWLPLILLALERILDGRSFGPFVAALTVCFLSTWYISYMIGAFCLLYFIARCIMLLPDRKALLRSLGRFLGGAACALGLTAWLWLPTFLAMFAGKFTGGNIDYSDFVTANLWDLVSRLWEGSYASITSDALPYIDCGLAALALAILYLFQRHPLREKLAWCCLCAAIGLSMFFSALDKAWHLFQKPNWFPWRYAFLMPFCVLLLAVQALPPVLAALREREGELAAKGAALALVLITVLELSGNTRSILAGLDSQFRYYSDSAYRAYYAANEELVKAAREDAGDGFFRMGATKDRGLNGPLSFGYAGITHYSSLYNYDVNQLTRRLGFAQSWMWCAYYGSTPATDALLGVRYVISQSELPYEAVAQSGGYTLYKNPNVLPIAFLSAGEDAPVLSAAATPFERQNDLLSDLAGGTVTAFTPVYAATSSAGTQTSFTFTGTGRAVYADLSAAGLRQVLVNGETVLYLGTDDTICIRCLGTPDPGEVWTVTIQHNGSWFAPEPFLWELDCPEPWESRWPAVAGAVQTIEKAEVLEVRQNGAVRLDLTTDVPRRLLTTVPAEDGWRAWVDGAPVDTVIWLETFLSLDVPAGTHQVELRYTAPGLMPGLALGLVSAAGLVLAYTRRILSKQKHREGRGSAP